MVGRSLNGVFLIFLLAALVALPARAFELGEARATGQIVAQALELGRSGDWASAEALVAETGDPVARDVVLWRKLRAGDGTTAEYQTFIARRPTWPGGAKLAEVVLGETPSRTINPGLSGASAEAWAVFDRAWRSRDWDTAYATIILASESAAGLGDPDRWAERRRSLVRRAQRDGRYREAYQMASRHFLSTGRSFADLEWLAGWLALRYLDDPGRAVGHFLRFQSDVYTPISVGRAGYWLGRSYEAMGESQWARYWYAEGAKHQTSFYGQLAAARLGLAGTPALASGGLPNWRSVPGLLQDDLRAATLIYYAGNRNLTLQFLVHLARTLPGEAQVAAVGALAIELGEPFMAVRLAKAAARRQMVIPGAYYPLHPLAQFNAGVEPALAMAIARQETELDQRAVSPAGARGLMQLMPGTARLVAGQLGLPYSRARLTEDWQYNATLGQTYLRDQILRFGGSYALAAAAYNAGPHRVDQWIAEYGDPRLRDFDGFIDWLETIPFNETRNYVQRVMEGIYVYRARLAGSAGPMSIVTDLNRGRR